MKLLRYFVGQYPWQSLVVLLCLMLAGLLEGLGLSALLPILGVVVTQDASAASAAKSEPSGLESIVLESLASVGLEPSLEVLIPFTIVAFWLKAGIVLFANRKVGYTVARVATDLRLALLRALMATRWSHFTQLRTGSAANALATEAERASIAYLYLAQVAGFAIQGSIYIGLAIAISWKATLAAVLMTAFMFVVLSALIRMAEKAGRKQTRFLKSLLSRITDSLQAVRMLKATGREPLIGPLLESDAHRLNEALRRRVLSKEALRALQEPLVVTFILSGAFVGLKTLAMPWTELLLLAYLAQRTMRSSNMIQRKYQLMMAESSALFSILKMIELAHSDSEPMPRGRAPSLEREIEIRDVQVCFNGSKVLDNFTLSIPAGLITALVGDSGTGKTTAADLVTGLIRPDAGVITIDGVALEDLDLRRWRQCIGYVPQENLMLRDSIEKNVSLGDPEVSPEDVERALRDAGAWDFISELPEGIHSDVGERGSFFSSGQRQRIAIARALVHGAKLLILDEATAALDNESEATVWAAIAKLRGKATVLAISHQPALAANADRIYRIEKGRAVPVEASGVA